LKDDSACCGIALGYDGGSTWFIGTDGLEFAAAELELALGERLTGGVSEGLSNFVLVRI
jgi:hypothetical protein